MLRDVGGWIKSKSSRKVCLPCAMRRAQGPLVHQGRIQNLASPWTHLSYHASLFVSLPRHLITPRGPEWLGDAANPPSTVPSADGRLRDYSFSISLPLSWHTTRLHLIMGALLSIPVFAGIGSLGTTLCSTCAVFMGAHLTPVATDIQVAPPRRHSASRATATRPSRRVSVTA